jgi:hypothetical protein
MRTPIPLTAAAVLAASASLAMAQSAQEHAAHHPQGASAPGAVKQARAHKPKVAAPAASAASGAMGMGRANMKKMHDEKHRPGGMHEQMHGKAAHAASGMAAASAAGQ